MAISLGAVSQRLMRNKWWVLGVIVILAGGSYYFGVYRPAKTAAASATYYVVNTVGKGDVSSGIETTGKIVAAQKLDLNVYKQLSRIQTVNITNGGHVAEGDTLVTFDKSDAAVKVNSSRVDVTSAQLSLQTAQDNSQDPSTQIRTLQSQITGFKNTLASTQQNITTAHTDFLNKDIEAVAGPGEGNTLIGKTPPALSGRYVSDEEGSYIIEFYHSGANSGFSYRLSGLETGSAPVTFGMAIDFGTRGLKMTVPTSVSAGDIWKVELPNVDTATYSENKSAYDQKIADLNATLKSTQTSLANAEQDLANAQQTDTSSYRDLNVEKAAQQLSQSQQQLSQNYDALRERDIIAPFPGTIQDMANVVTGATPTGGTNDSINLGTLVSDKFLTTFTLGATDVAKVSVGQKVKVTITSLRGEPNFDATITQISSLPSSSGVAQYEVQAELDYDRTKSDVALREGMLSDIEVVQQEKQDAIRVPVSAITYENGQPMVKVVDSLTQEQEQQVSKSGALRVQTGTTLATRSVSVKLGIQGKYYVEVTDGLKEGDRVVITTVEPQTTNTAVQFRGFGPGGGGGGNRQQGGNGGGNAGNAGTGGNNGGGTQTSNRAAGGGG